MNKQNGNFRFGVWKNCVPKKLPRERVESLFFKVLNTHLGEESVTNLYNVGSNLVEGEGEKEGINTI